MRLHAGGSRFVAEFPVDPIHDRARLARYTDVSAEGDIDAPAARLPGIWKPGCFPANTARSARAPSVRRYSSTGGRAARIGNIQRQVVDADAAFDLQLRMRLRQLEVMGEVLEQVGEAPQAGGGDHPDQRGQRFLIGKASAVQDAACSGCGSPAPHNGRSSGGAPRACVPVPGVAGSAGPVTVVAVVASAMRPGRRVSGTPPRGKSQSARASAHSSRKSPRRSG